MKDKRLTVEDEQLLLLEQPKADLFDWEITAIHVGTLRSMLDEIRLAWRVRSALGWQDWPEEKSLLNWEGDQEKMRREYEADVRERGEQ